MAGDRLAESGDLGERTGVAGDEGWRRRPRRPPSAGVSSSRPELSRVRRSTSLAGERDTPCRRGFSALDGCGLEPGLRGELRGVLCEAWNSRSCTLSREYGALPLLICGVPSSCASSCCCCCSLCCRRFASASSLALAVRSSILATCSCVAAEIARDRREGGGEAAAGGFPQRDIPSGAAATPGRPRGGPSSVCHPVPLWAQCIAPYRIAQPLPLSGNQSTSRRRQLPVALPCVGETERATSTTF